MLPPPIDSLMSHLIDLDYLPGWKLPTLLLLCYYYSWHYCCGIIIGGGDSKGCYSPFLLLWCFFRISTRTFCWDAPQPARNAHTSALSTVRAPLATHLALWRDSDVWMLRWPHRRPCTGSGHKSKRRSSARSGSSSTQCTCQPLAALLNWLSVESGCVLGLGLLRRARPAARVPRAHCENSRATPLQSPTKLALPALPTEASTSVGQLKAPTHQTVQVSS